MTMPPSTVPSGLPSEPMTMTANDVTAHVADEGVDFIVMGGYGQSRLREFVLGGVTRSVLRSMTVPVLMSH
jgi:nucleotide-binding universal stress UspA family protein